jgi:hypothetical protein
MVIRTNKVNTEIITAKRTSIAERDNSLADDLRGFIKNHVIIANTFKHAAKTKNELAVPVL